MKKNNNSIRVIIEEGDTLFSVSKRYNVNIDELVRVNRITYPYQLKSGGYLFLPENNHRNDNLEVNVESGYKVEYVALGLTYPTSITFDNKVNLYIGESGFSYGPAKVEGGGKIKKIDPTGNITVIAKDFKGPLTGLTWYKGFFYVAVGSNPGKIYRVDSSGNKEIIVDGFPTGGDHYTSNIIFDQNGKMYFGIGTFTNSAVVGLDNINSGWVAEHPNWHDISPVDIELRGINYKTINPFDLNNVQFLLTGAYHPFGEPSVPQENIKGRLKANGVIYAVNKDGTNLEQYATGLRNPYALAFSPKGDFICIDQGYDARGSRPIANAPDPMYRIKKGKWYGWPDYVAGIPVTDSRFKTAKGNDPKLILAKHPEVYSDTITTFTPHAAAMQFDFSRNHNFGHIGKAFIALFGSLTPITGNVKDHPGHKVVRLDMNTGKYVDFLTSKHVNGHAPIRPIDAKFSPDGKSLYVLDFGRLDIGKTEMTPYSEAGKLWRITKL